MTVKELIEELSAYPAHYNVRVALLYEESKEEVYLEPWLSQGNRQPYERSAEPQSVVNIHVTA